MRTHYAALMAPLAVLLLQPSSARADSANTTGDTVIVITATKTPTPLKKVTSSVTVISSNELNATHQPLLIDALRLVPGLYISQFGGPGTDVSVFLRGGSPGDTLVLIDGVPVNDPSSPDRSYDLSNLTVDNVDRVEVLRGAQSTLYGSNATAGLINIITKQGKGSPISSFAAEGGAYSTASGQLSSLGTVNGWDYSASGSKYVTSGFPLAALQPGDTEKDGYRNETLSARLDKQISDALAFDFTTRYIRAADHYAGYGSLNGATYIALDDGTHEYNSEEIVSRASLDWKPTFCRWSTSVGAESNSLNRDYLDLPNAAYSSIDYSTGPGNYNGRMYKLFLQSNYHANRANLFTVGAETEQDRAQYNSIAYGESLNARSLTTWSGYLQDQLTLSRKLSATLGSRLDDIQLYGHQGTYHAGLNYKVTRGTSLKADFATGFKAPTLYDLYDPNYGNVNLKPETSQTFDAGIDQAVLKGRGSVSATYYNDRYLNLFSYNPVTFQTINIGQATADGAELDAGYNLGAKLNIDLNYTYTRARDNFGKALDRRPGTLYAASIQYRATTKLSFDVTGQYVGNRNDTDGTAVPVVLPSYTLINLASEYKVGPTVKVFARIENLTNADYQEDYSYRSAGRGIYGGFSTQL